MRNPPDDRPFKSLDEPVYGAGRGNAHAHAPHALDPEPDPHTRWQRLVDARLIGDIPPMTLAAIDAIVAAETALGLRRAASGERA